MGKTTYPSEYELKYCIWTGLEYDRNKLIKFIYRLEYFKRKLTLGKYDKLEYKVLKEIHKSLDKKNISKLINNDPEYTRWAFIEKWARRAAREIAINGKYSEKTFKIISNIPTGDYKILIKRCQELNKLINQASTVTLNNSETIPGVK